MQELCVYNSCSFIFVETNGMFFFLSKILFFLLVPLNWIIALVILRFVVKNPILKKRLSIATIVLLFFFGNDFILNKLVRAWQTEPVEIGQFGNYSAGIVLGGYESFDRKGKGYLNYASDRFIQTLALYKQGKIKKIVVSGSKVVDGKVEISDYVKQQFILCGVAPADIILENLSKNTFENSRFSKRLLDSAGLQPPFVLITSAMHDPRARKVFQKAGVEVVSFPCNFQFFDKRFSFDEYFFPKAIVLDQWTYFLKEIVGIGIYTLVDKA